MKTVLRLLARKEGSGFIEIPNPYNMIPRKDDYIVWDGKSYIVGYVEFDFDSDTLYIVSVV